MPRTPFGVESSAITPPLPPIADELHQAGFSILIDIDTVE